MKVGVISDTHDRLDNLEKAIQRFEEARVGAIIHCGDMVSPFAVPLLFRPKAPVYAVFGNNDGERIGLWNRMKNHDLGTIMPGPIQVELGGRKIIVSHEPLPNGLLTADVDAILFGHTHEAVLRGRNPLILNPGECCGWVTGRATAAILDLDAMDAEIFQV